MIYITKKNNNSYFAWVCYTSHRELLASNFALKGKQKGKNSAGVEEKFVELAHEQRQEAVWILCEAKKKAKKERIMAKKHSRNST
ncbi:hypothetical protein A6R68_19743, partial [Neotoma lepida]